MRVVLLIIFLKIIIHRTFVIFVIYYFWYENFIYPAPYFPALISPLHYFNSLSPISPRLSGFAKGTVPAYFSWQEQYIECTNTVLCGGFQDSSSEQIGNSFGFCGPPDDVKKFFLYLENVPIRGKSYDDLAVGLIGYIAGEALNY